MKICPYCTNEVEDNAVKCKYCGGWFTNDAEEKQNKINEQERLEKVLQDKKDKIGEEVGERTQYFAVPRAKLIVLFILSFGLYELYWFYKNWKAIKVQEGKKISPFGRAIFALIFCYSLFKRIFHSATQKGYQPKISYGHLTAAYITLVMLHKLPDPFWLISSLSFLPLLYVADVIQFNNAYMNPDATENRKFTISEIIFAFIGILLWVVTILDFLYPAY